MRLFTSIIRRNIKTYLWCYHLPRASNANCTKIIRFYCGRSRHIEESYGKKKRKELEKQKMRFIEGAVKKGINREIAASIFFKIEPFNRVWF